ncbi:hypothetical protein EV138_6040 [Kribbella voronezhensis]|uniref:Histidine kinase/DNA gyrase B/HSP90-like ATPase n=1 Tax=Kribbella voronezhensis TaxID=2512212 RepID=A0A4R7SXY9_9ACTN|nr:hypothetical protein [Kribbella voronezhensis]TDU83576.1 hypothetical protein EV138_6040 [Kribbella voronezhensis]
MIDVFGTAAIRERVLTAWAAAPVRFREDANAEEDLALGGYLDRVVVELAQNAADAAARAGVPGGVHFSFRDGTLVVANTGTPLSAEGVESLATLRASAKRDDAEASVGRFGVGFSAVLAVTDEPVILSRTGGVRFSRADSAAAVAEAGAGSPGLADEVRRRDGQVPVLRLPFEADGEPPEGYDTAVILPLRDEAASELVRRLLGEADDALLLALPGLERIEIDLDGDVRELVDAESRWYVQRASGILDENDRERLLADRPTEERWRPHWSVLWALPRDPLATVPRTVHAPTPTDEPLSLPALLLATFPLDPSRRHVAAGPLTDRLVAEAAAAYAELLRNRAEQGANILPLVPVGLAAGGLDRAVREAILAASPTTPLLRAVDDGSMLPPREAVAIEGSDDAFNAAMAPLVPGLIASPRQDRTALDALGVRRLELADLVDQLGTVAETRPPEWWREIYGALSEMVTDPLLRESLGTLPVPLADGRLVRGVRGLLLPGQELAANVLAVFGEYGVRVVHPDAVHGTLERLGALPTTPRALLEDSAVRSAVEHSGDADDPEAIADAVLTVVAADPSQADGLWWLADLALRDAEGELVPANALVIPGSAAAAVLDDEEVAPIDQTVVDRFGIPALEAIGVLDSLATVAASDVVLDDLPESLADLDGIEDWAYDVAPGGSRFGATVGEVAAIRDLDWVVDDAWPQVLELIGATPELRRALVETVRVVGPDDRAVGGPSYSAWWIREHLILPDGEPLAGRADPEADPVLAEYLDPAPEWTAGLDPEVRTAVGLVREVGDLEADGVAQVLTRLADPAREVGESALLRLWNHLGRLTVYASEPPTHIRVLTAESAGPLGWQGDESGGAVAEERGALLEFGPGGGSEGAGRTVIVAAGEAVVADAPMWLQRGDLGGFVVGSGVVADGLGDLLDLPMAQEVAEGKIDGLGTEADVPAIVGELVPQTPALWWEHEELTVDGVEVSWWVSENGEPHAATFDGLAKALAWAAGRWDQRHVILAILSDPTRASELLIDAAFDQTPDTTE